VGPEILIVGDRSHRGALIPRVQDLGYTVTPVRERELSGRVAGTPAPAAVLICLGDADAAALVAAARRGRDDVPVVIYGALGGALRDLADVLELGADHFLAAPVGDAELARALAELAGPGAPDDDPGLWREDEDPVRPLTETPGLGQLHRTLEILAARLQSHAGESEPDALELDSLGLDAVPDVDRELDPPEAGALLTDPESSDPAAPRRREATQRLAQPRTGARPRPPTEDSRGAMQGEDTMRLRAPSRVIGAVREDRSGREGERTGAVREDRSGRAGERTGAVREDRSAERRPRTGPGDTTARVLARRPEDGRGVRGVSDTTARLSVPRVDADTGMARDDDPGARGAGDTTARLRVPRADGRAAGAPADTTARPGRPRDDGRDARVPADATAPRDDGRAARAPGDATARLTAPRADTRAVDAGRTDPRGAGDLPRPEVTEPIARRPREAVGRDGERLLGAEVVDRLWQLHARRSDGRLTVGFVGGEIKQVWWRRGEPVYATSTAVSDGLLARLQARGLLARAQVSVAARHVDDDLVASARRLVQAGLLKPREQQDVVRDVVTRIVESVCSDAAIRWQFAAEPPPTEVAPAVPVLALLAAGARLGLSRDRLRARLPEDVALRLEVEDVAALAGELRWPGADAWLGLLDGSRSLGLLVAEDGLDERELWAAGVVLLAAGLAVRAEPDADAVLLEIDRRRIDERLALARGSDYFTLLGVGRDAGRVEVLRAYEDLRATFADAHLEPRTRAALAEPLAELHAALDEARVVLVDETLRAAYLAHYLANLDSRSPTDAAPGTENR
jgi:CheY-like chemotaxis protein